jgi:hypothetical protein
MLTDLLQDVQTAPARHRDVGDDDVPLFFQYFAEELIGVDGFADMRGKEFLQEDLTEALADYRVVLGDQDA